MSVPVHAQAQELLDARAAAGVPPTWEQTPEQARATVAASLAGAPPGPAVASARDITIPGRAGGLPGALGRDGRTAN